MLTKLKTIWVIFFTIISFNAYGFLMGEWRHYSPGGIMMEDNGNGNQLVLYTTKEAITLKISEWYFYKNHIVGMSDKGYFIVNEGVNELYLFKTELEWRNSISQNGLKPFITRWYADNWIDMDYILIWLIFGFIVTIPLAGIFLWVLYKAIVFEDFKISEPNTKIALSVIIIVSGIILLDIYPQSL